MSVSSVVLPQPDGPVRSTTSPGQMSRSMSKSTWLRRPLSSYEKSRPRMRTAGSLVARPIRGRPPSPHALRPDVPDRIQFAEDPYRIID